MYLYLPAINRERRISGTSRDGSLFGTDLSYQDIRNMQLAFQMGKAKKAVPTTYQGRKAHVVEVLPSSEDESRYDKIVATVDDEACVALHAEFFESGKASKEYSVDAKTLAKYKKHWYAKSAEMKDLREGSRTTLEVTGVKLGADVPSRYFQTSSFYLGN